MRVLGLLLALGLSALAQNCSLSGVVRDAQQGVIAHARVTLTNDQTGTSQSGETDEQGRYLFSLVRPGSYVLTVATPGFKTYRQSRLTLEVDHHARVDVNLAVGDAATVITVEATAQGAQVASSGVGEVMGEGRILEVPLNGRYFLDLALLTPGSVVPSTNRRTVLAAPSSLGSSGINSAGAREDSTNYILDGVGFSDAIQNQIAFQPNLEMIQEFKVQASAYPAEYGRSAGIVIVGVSKSGSNALHGSLYEYFRNETLDAKNYFDSASARIPPFKRNIFGVAGGGPLVRNRTFFFGSYEGRRGRESSSLRTAVPSDAQRAAAANPVVKELLTLIPRANAAGNFFVQSVPRVRDANQFTGRLDHTISDRHLLFATVVSNRDVRTEPTLQGNNLPGAGDSRPSARYFLSLGWTALITSRLTNDFRTGWNRVKAEFVPDASVLNPADFGMNTGSMQFPRVAISGAAAFGGISGFPQGRADTTVQLTDTLAWVKGRHAWKFGAEWRRFYNNNFNAGTGGVLNFASIGDFIRGTPSMASQQINAADPALHVDAFNLFAQDDFKIGPRLTINYGLRYEFNGVPSERYGRIAVYDFASNTLVPAAKHGIDKAYNGQQNNFGPRLGLGWDPLGGGRTVIRAGVGLYYDQPVTSLVQALGNNPPYSTSVAFVSTAQKPIVFDLSQPFNLPGGQPAVFNVNAVAPNYRSGLTAQYNFNIQHEEFRTVFQASYVGSTGRHLRLARDYNQGIDSVRPIPGFGTISLNESRSRSSYNALWLTASRPFLVGLTISASYAYSKSIDLNSSGSANPQIQDSYNVAAERALSDFDARHRFVFSFVYELPWSGNGHWRRRLLEGWSVAPVANLQSGNPFSPIMPTSRSGSLDNFDRPDILPDATLAAASPSPSMWFNATAFAPNAIGRFGNAGRNILTGPGFQDVDLVIAKTTKWRERYQLQFRVSMFNLLNHPNFAQPGNSVGTATFGVITQTRTARGDFGSSRQLQLGLRLAF